MSTRKGEIRLKNTPVFYDELKKRRQIMLTPTAWNNIRKLSAAKGISASELIEAWARNLRGE